MAPQGSSGVGQTSIWDLGVQSSGQGLGVDEWLSGSLGKVRPPVGQGALRSFSMVGLERPCKVWPRSLALGWVGSGHSVPCGDRRVAELYGAYQPEALRTSHGMPPRGFVLGHPHLDQCIQMLHGKTFWPAVLGTW